MLRKLYRLSFVVVLVFPLLSYAHRDSDYDNLVECRWNEKYLDKENLNVSCNDLYHLYQSTEEVKTVKTKQIKIGSFNMYILAGRNRNKEFPILSRIFNAYDLMAVSEVHHATTEELKSNINLSKNSDLDIKKYYHAPGYLRLLMELRKTNPSWSLILSPAAQSESEELLGFYYKSDRIKLTQSEYCEESNRDLREERRLHFAGGILKQSHGRKPVSPYLNRSYGCTLRIDKNENEISRIPFSARFKTSSGFDFQYLSYHARYDAPIAVGRTCGFECMELVSEFYNLFHKEGEYLKTLDYTSLRLLSGHIKYLSLKASSSKRGLFDGFSALTKLKYGKPRIYDNVIRIRSYFAEQIPVVLEKVWKKKFSKKISRTHRDKVKKFLLDIFSSPSNYDQFKKYIKTQGRVYKDFVQEIFESEPFASVDYRIEIWQQPADISRFYALSLISEEMDQISSKERDRDVILGGDLNLEVKEKNSFFWNFLKKEFEYADVFVETPTSIGNVGIANAYDHFVFDLENSLEECEGENFFVTDFVNDLSWWKGFEDYFVKSRSDIEKVSDKAFNNFSQLDFVQSRGKVVKASEYNVSSGYKDCWDGKTYRNQSLAKVWQKKLECQTLKFYLDKTEPYRVFKDIISDHMPVGLTCKNNKDLD